MNSTVKERAKKAYNQSAKLWHETRAATLENTSKSKLIKQNRPHLFVEKPAMHKKISNLKGKKVLCLGCGSGEETDYILSKKPDKLFGVDISESLIEIARKYYPKVNFSVMDAEDLKFPDNYFDLVYSSLVLDYFKSWKKVLSEVNRILKPIGNFIFSDIHPVKWSSKKINDDDGKATGCLMGYDRDPGTRKQIIFGNYLNVVKHTEVWMKSMKITSYSRPISIAFKELVNVGFEVLDIDEPKAIEATKKYDYEYWEVNQKIPNFIIFVCKKRS